MKVYNVKSNARRAARAAGLDPDQAVRIVDGGFVVHGLAAAPVVEAPDLAETTADEDVAVPQFVKDTFRRGAKTAPAEPPPAEQAKPEPKAKGARKAPREASDAPTKAAKRPAGRGAAKAPQNGGRAATSPASDGARESKGSALVEMVKRPEGVTVAEAAERFGWLPHTTRAAISVQCRKAGLTVTTEAVDGRGRVYRAA